FRDLIPGLIDEIPLVKGETRAQWWSTCSVEGARCRSQRALRDARSSGIVHVLNDGRALIALALHRTELTLGIVPVPVVAVVKRVPRRIVTERSCQEGVGRNRRGRDLVIVNGVIAGDNLRRGITAAVRSG